jgi:hypothetical protein
MKTVPNTHASATGLGIAIDDLFAWQRAIVKSGVSANARLLVLALSTHYNAGAAHVTGAFSPAGATLAEEMGKHAANRAPVNSATKELVAAGFLIVTSGGGTKKKNAYQAALPVGHPELERIKPEKKADAPAPKAEKSNCVATDTDNCVATNTTNCVATNTGPTVVPSSSSYPPKRAGEEQEASGTDRLIQSLSPEDEELFRSTMNAICSRLTEQETEKVAAEIHSGQFAAREAFAQKLVSLVKAGLGDAVIADLTKSDDPTQPAYNKARTISAVMFNRLKQSERINSWKAGNAEDEQIAPEIAEMIGQMLNGGSNR